MQDDYTYETDELTLLPLDFMNIPLSEWHKVFLIPHRQIPHSACEACNHDGIALMKWFDTIGQNHSSLCELLNILTLGAKVLQRLFRSAQETPDIWLLSPIATEWITAQDLSATAIEILSVRLWGISPQDLRMITQYENNAHIRISTFYDIRPEAVLNPDIEVNTTIFQALLGECFRKHRLPQSNTVILSTNTHHVSCRILHGSHRLHIKTYTEDGTGAIEIHRQRDESFIYNPRLHRIQLICSPRIRTTLAQTIGRYLFDDPETLCEQPTYDLSILARDGSALFCKLPGTMTSVDLVRTTHQAPCAPLVTHEMPGLLDYYMDNTFPEGTCIEAEFVFHFDKRITRRAIFSIGNNAARYRPDAHGLLIACWSRRIRSSDAVF